MRFRLTYQGELRPTQRDPEKNQTSPLAAHKHSIRQCFHQQLKELWSTNKFLKECRVDPNAYGGRPIHDDAAYFGGKRDSKIPYVDAVASNYHEFGYRFVPLVREKISLVCSLNILFLRRDFPGGVITSAGDIDNRIKTVIDALRKPQSPNELVGHERPSADEDPFFCLMEDDSQVDRFTVETDQLLDTDAEPGDQMAHLTITVDVRPFYVTTFNLSFAS